MKYALAVFAVLIISAASYALFMPSRCRGDMCGTISPMTASFNDPRSFLQQLQEGAFVLVDVREESEWAAGHIAGAIHIPLGSLNADTTKDLPKDKPVYIYCRSGARAGNAEQILKGFGYDNAKNVGGIIVWQQNGGALVQ